MLRPGSNVNEGIQLDDWGTKRPKKRGSTASNFKPKNGDRLDRSRFRKVPEYEVSFRGEYVDSRRLS